MIANDYLLSHTFPRSQPQLAGVWSLLNDSGTDESAPSQVAPFPSTHHPLSTTLGPAFDPALCVTPERKPSLRVPLRHPPVSGLGEDDGVLDRRSIKVHFDQTVSVHHLSPEFSSNGGSPDDHHDELASCSELNTSDFEPISIIASDLRRLSPSLVSSVDDLASGRNAKHSNAGTKKTATDGPAKKKKLKGRSKSKPQVVSEFGSSGGHLADSVPKCREPDSSIEPDCVLARPEFNSTLKISNEITDLQEQQFDFAAITQEKIGPKLKQQVFEKACLKVNQGAVVYPDLISLEVSEAEVLSKVADEQARHARHVDAAASAAGDKAKPEDRISRPPDIMDFFTPDLQKESASVNMVAIPAFQISPQTADLDRAFDLYRHIRTWDCL